MFNHSADGCQSTFATSFGAGLAGAGEGGLLLRCLTLADRQGQRSCWTRDVRRRNRTSARDCPGIICDAGPQLGEAARHSSWRRLPRRTIDSYCGWTTTMLGRTLLGLLVGIVAGMLYPPLARADIYTWVDGAGVTNVSNLPPPEGVRTSTVTRAPPNDPAREAARREAARESEMRALNERVQQLQAEVEQSRRETPPPGFFVPPPMHYAPAPAPPYVIVVSAPPPAYPQPSNGCDYSWGNCGFGFWPGFYPTSVVGLRDRHFRHHQHPFRVGRHDSSPVRTGKPWRK